MCDFFVLWLTALQIQFPWFFRIASSSFSLDLYSSLLGKLVMVAKAVMLQLNFVTITENGTSSQLSLLRTKSKCFVLWSGQGVYLRVYNCGIQFFIRRDTVKLFKEHVWDFIWPRDWSDAFVYLWDQESIRFLHESCSILGSLLHRWFILDVFLVKFWCVMFSRGILSLGKGCFSPLRISKFNMRLCI